MKDYQASYSEKFKEALRKFNDSATALYFIVQTSTSHDYSDPNKDLIATYQKVSLTTKPGKESINITVIKNVIGFGIATSLEQVNEIITYMEADNRDLRKIYFYDYDLVIQELVPPKASDLIATKPNFSQPINGAWGAFPPVTDTDGDVKKKGNKAVVDEHPTASIPGFEG